MANEGKDTGNTIFKVILYVFFVSAFLTIIVFIIGQGWFNPLIEQLNWPYETLEMIRSILVKVFMGTAITSFVTSITAVVLLIFRS
ncbi:MAG: hypothetical protein E3J93_05735 [Dehalococcoidia bacterium]|nr:MAG: hypothetical protein E3J93_05735 [Dehalococcoidia bacterium]